MRKLVYTLLAAITLTSLSPLQAAPNSLTVSRANTETEHIFRAALPANLSIKEDFQVSWGYDIKYVTAQGYVGTPSTPQTVKKIDFKNAEFVFYLPLNGTYQITFKAQVVNDKKTIEFNSIETLEVTRPDGFTISEIPNDVIPGVYVPDGTDGSEIIQVKVGSNSNKAGDSPITGYVLGDYVRLVIFSKGRVHTETIYDVCQGQKLECTDDSIPGFSMINLKKSFYASHRLYYSSNWTIRVAKPFWSANVYTYRFENKQEINVPAWGTLRSSAPEALGATAGLKCPYSFKGSVLSCTITPENKFRNAKSNPIWVDVKVFADGIEQKNLTRQIKTRIGNTSSLKFKLPSSYKELDITATTLGIEGVTQNQSWESTKPLTSEERQRSYRSGYNSILYSSQSDLESVDFYGSVTGANGKVIRLKAQSWCKNIIFNQFARGVQIKSSDDWIRGCTDAAMKL